MGPISRWTQYNGMSLFETTPIPIPLKCGTLPEDGLEECIMGSNEST